MELLCDGCSWSSGVARYLWTDCCTIVETYVFVKHIYKKIKLNEQLKRIAAEGACAKRGGHIGYIGEGTVCCIGEGIVAKNEASYDKVKGCWIWRTQ